MTRRALGPAVLLAACGWLAALAGDRQAFLEGYLAAWCFWAGLPLGALSMLMLHHLTGGAWGAAVRRPLEAAALAVPWMGLLFLPVLFGLPELYPWASAEHLAREPVLVHRAAWLNPSLFVLRWAGLFVLWTTGALLLRRWSLQATPRSSLRLQAFSGPGLLLHMLFVSVAAVDWMMSLETHFYSTGFGWLVMISQALAMLALAIATVALVRRESPLEAQVFHDLGNLLLAFVLVWTYLSFAQYLVIWNGNLHEDNEWYFFREGGPWFPVAVTLVAGHFLLPFLALLPAPMKTRAGRLQWVALWFVLMEAVHVYWLVKPALVHADPFHWVDLAAQAALGGTFLALYLWALGRAPLLPRPLEGE